MLVVDVSRVRRAHEVCKINRTICRHAIHFSGLVAVRIAVRRIVCGCELVKPLAVHMYAVLWLCKLVPALECASVGARAGCGGGWCVRVRLWHVEGGAHRFQLGTGVP